MEWNLYWNAQPYNKQLQQMVTGQTRQYIFVLNLLLTIWIHTLHFLDNHLSSGCLMEKSSHCILPISSSELTTMTWLVHPKPESLHLGKVSLQHVRNNLFQSFLQLTGNTLYKLLPFQCYYFWLFHNDSYSLLLPYFFPGFYHRSKHFRCNNKSISCFAVGKQSINLMYFSLLTLILMQG